MARTIRAAARVPHAPGIEELRGAARGVARRRRERGVSRRPAPHDDRAPIDVSAAALSILGLTVLGWSLMKFSGRAANSVHSFLGLLVAASFFLALVLVERAKRDCAMLPPALFAARTVVSLNVFTLALYGAFAANLTAAIDNLRQAFASVQSSETSHTASRPDEDRPTHHRRHHRPRN